MSFIFNYKYSLVILLCQNTRKLFTESSHIYVHLAILIHKRGARAKHEAPHDKGEGKSFIIYNP